MERLFDERLLALIAFLSAFSMSDIIRKRRSFLDNFTRKRYAIQTQN